MEKGKRCERCKFFKTRQGKGVVGECRVNHPIILPGSTYGEFPIVDKTTWCGEFQLDLENYHDDGRKIYQRHVVKSKAQLDAYHNGDPKWNKK